MDRSVPVAPSFRSLISFGGHGTLFPLSARNLTSLISRLFLQLIFSVFKTLTDQQVTVELKNDLSITGVLKSVDQ